MAISAGMALISTATASLTGTLIAGSMMTHFLVTTAMGAALNALAPKPSMPSGATGANAANRGYQVSTRGAALDHQIIYGRTKVGGAIVFDAVSGANNKILHRVIVFAGHPCATLHNVYFNDERLDTTTATDSQGQTYYKPTGAFDQNGTSHSRYNENVRIYKRFGRGGTLADEKITTLIQAGVGWTDQHLLENCAFIYLRLEYDADVFPNGVPDVTADISGKEVWARGIGLYHNEDWDKLYDNNPVWCIADYLLDADYGLGESFSSIDNESFVKAAEIAEYKSYPDYLGDYRFRCNGAFTTAVTPHDQLMDLLSSCAGILWYSGGKWRIKVGYYDAPATDGSVDFNEDDLRSAIQVSTRNSRRDNFNTVRGVFRGPETRWQPTDYAQVQVDAETLSEGFNNQVSVYDLDLPYTTDFDMCRHLALITLERNLQQVTVSASFGMRAFKLEVGDIIRLSNTRFGWTNKEFEVIQWTFGLKGESDLQVDMVLREIASTVFDETSDGLVYLHDNTTLLSPFEVPTISITPADLGGVIKIINEKVLRELQVNVSTTDASRVDLVEVQYRESPIEFAFTHALTQQNLANPGQWKMSTASSPSPSNTGSLVWSTSIRTIMAYMTDPDQIAQVQSLETGDYLTFTSDQHGSGYVTMRIESTYYNTSNKVAFFYLTNPGYVTISNVGSVSGAADANVYFQVSKGGLEFEEYRPMGSGGLGRYTVPDLDIGYYDIRARATNTFGIKGNWTYQLQVELNPPDEIPADVGTISFDISQGTCFLRWPPVADKDLSYYEVKFSSATSGATWATATTVIERVARPGTNATLPARSGTFFIKAVDKIGQYSANASSVVVLPSQLPQLGNTDTQEEDAAFAGVSASTNVVIDTTPNPDVLTIDDTSAATPVGYYNFGGSINGGANGTYIDTGSARTARATGIVTFVRHIDYAEEWDNIPGTWDTWPGTWDTWLDEDAAFNDNSVSVEVRATNDDPSGTPTWGSWLAANGQEIVGRAFQIRAVLNATHTGVSPAIQTLEAEVTY